MKLESYGLIGDMNTAALVGTNGSIDWLCLPRFDSDACFAALLGTPDNGCWCIAPKQGQGRVRATQRYRPDTLVLENEFTTPEGAVRLTDFMPPGEGCRQIYRIVEGIRGRVAMRMYLTIRLNYGRTLPWVRRADGGISAIGGPDAFLLRSSVRPHGEKFATVAEFNLRPGDRQTFILTWHPSNLPPPRIRDPLRSLRRTERFWRAWAGRCTYRGQWREAVVRSLITLKALTYAPTGGIVAAPTTSLPEKIGGIRNWDYRYCWLRDASLTLLAFMGSGYKDEARAWGSWLLRAVAGDPAQLQIVYGASGEQRLTEIQLGDLPGYEDSPPVRIGNAAAGQFQLDVFGELMAAMQISRRVGIRTAGESWDLQLRLVDFVEKNWRKPDEGIWEIRGPRRHFTHSKMMAWVAIDRAVKGVEHFGLKGPVTRWRRLRRRIHDDVCLHGYNARRGVFTQCYGSSRLDASLLMMPIVGFLPATDKRVTRTIDAIHSRLGQAGLVYRYHPGTSRKIDGLPPGEGIFLPCSFWMVDCLTLLGRKQEAETLFEKLLAMRNGLGLLAEEYDPVKQRLVGNFPQAFSHVALVNSARRLSSA